MQRSGQCIHSGSGLMPSGLWHQAHASGHPLKKTVVLIPGPSWIEYRLTAKIKPLRDDCESSGFRGSGNVFTFMNTARSSSSLANLISRNCGYKTHPAFYDTPRRRRSIPHTDSAHLNCEAHVKTLNIKYRKK